METDADHSNSNKTVGHEPAAKVKAACEECRTRKTKCDGVRPACGRCESKGRRCLYETQPDEFRVTALKRRFHDLSRSSADTTALIQLLREQGYDKALEILGRLRSNDSIVSILEEGKNPRTAAEGAVLDAIDQVRTSTSPEAAQPSSSLDQEPEMPLKNGGIVDKQSIAFLCGEAAGHFLPTPAPVEQQADIDLSPTTVEPGGTETPRPTISERRRRSGPGRLGLQEPSSTAPIFDQMHPTFDLDALANPSSVLPKHRTSGMDRTKAADWEVYYTDDHTFLEILKCYFVWENPVLGFVVESAFWEGFLAGGSEFCNGPLVHSILAYGCKIYGMFYPEKAAAVEHFALLEVTKMWDWDADASVPANTSAGLIIHAILTANGQDTEGIAYFDGAMNLAIRSGFFNPERASQVYPSSGYRLAQDRATFAWNVYVYHGYYTLMFSKEPQLSRTPPVDIPARNVEEDSKHWEPFLLLGPPRPSLSSSKTHARAQLWRIASEILPLHRNHAQDARSDEHLRDAFALYDELREWNTNLDPRLGNIHGATPQVFALHTDYLRCVVDVFRPFADAAEPPKLTEDIDRTRSIVRACRRQMRLLVHQMELQYPGHPISLSAVLNPLTSVANETLPALWGQDPVLDAPFYLTLALKLMRRMSTAYPVTRYLIVAVQSIAHRIGATLPPAAQSIIDLLEPAKLTAAPISSSLPFHHVYLTSDLNAANLQNLIGETERLRIVARRPSVEANMKKQNATKSS